MVDWNVPLNIHQSLVLRNISINTSELQLMSDSINSLAKTMVDIERVTMSISRNTGAILYLLKTKEHREHTISQIRNLVFAYNQAAQAARNEREFPLISATSLLVTKQMLNSSWFDISLFSAVSFEEMEVARNLIGGADAILVELSEGLSRTDKNHYLVFASAIARLDEVKRQHDEIKLNFERKYIHGDPEYWGVGTRYTEEYLRKRYGDDEIYIYPSGIGFLKAEENELKISNQKTINFLVEFSHPVNGDPRTRSVWGKTFMIFDIPKIMLENPTLWNALGRATGGEVIINQQRFLGNISLFDLEERKGLIRGLRQLIAPEPKKEDYAKKKIFGPSPERRYEIAYGEWIHAEGGKLGVLRQVENSHRLVNTTMAKIHLLRTEISTIISDANQKLPTDLQIYESNESSWI